MKSPPIPPAPPLARLRLSLVGTGRVGSSLAWWMQRQGAVIETIAGRATTGGGRHLAARLGVPWVEIEALSSAGQDLLLVAVTDRAITPLAAVLARRAQAQVVLHTAGSLDVHALAPLRGKKCALGSLHPLKAFAAEIPDPAAAHGTLFAIDGDPAAQALANRLVAAWQGVAVTLEGEERVRYHLAATLAAGGVATLLATAQEIGATLPIPSGALLAGYVDLARSALDAIERASDPLDAITGPVARGDRDTCSLHLAALTSTAPELVPTILRLSRETLRQLARRTPADAHRAALDRMLAAELDEKG